MKIKLPVSVNTYQWVNPEMRWQSIWIDASDKKVLEENFDSNFYVEYKQAK
jgi:hypothetical protein